MLPLAARSLQAPVDPAGRGLWELVALVLLVGLAAAHVRILRAVAREQRAEEPTPASPQAASAEPSAERPRW